MVAARLSRKQKQEHTKACLLASAARVFARRGFHAASVDEVAEDAGFSKGAVYSNFDGKDDLFLATVDAHFDRRLEQIRSAMEQPPPGETRTQRIGLDFAAELASDPEWMALFYEFWAYAQRNPKAAAKLVPRVRHMRDGLAEIFVEFAARMGIEPPVPPDQLGLMTLAMATGVGMEKLLDPDDVPDDLFASMLAVFFRGVRAVHHDRSKQREAVT